MTGVSVILPAHDEADFLAPCLDALLASDTSGIVPRLIVVANGCTDATADLARSFGAQAEAAGWTLEVIETPVGDKLNALTLGEGASPDPVLIYLDADVIVSPDLIGSLTRALDTESPRYGTGTVELARAQTWVSRAYGRFWKTLPFVTQTAPGFGLFAMNRAGRARWGDWPRIISDDTFARLSFAPDERVQVPERYTWPLVEGFGNLVKVRRRQNRGVAEVERDFSELLVNADQPALTGAGIVMRALRSPLGFVVYAAVSLAVKLPGSSGWTRGR